MKKLSLILILICSALFIKAQSADTLTVYYYENFPYAYMSAGKLVGIEVEIIEQYTAWLMQKKNVSLFVSYKPYTDFSSFYNSVKDGNSKVIGLGSVTSNSEREKEVSFSAPYLKNVAVLITAGKIPSVQEKNSADVVKGLGTLKAIAVNKSSHLTYLNELKTAFIPTLIIETTDNQNKVLDRIVSDNTYFGYVDIVAYWSYLKNNPSKFLKNQKVFNAPTENLGFIMPKKSTHSAYINEFFETGFGFTSTKVYHQILEKYLGYEIIESVEVK
jgi:putative glutamine transport system substrate-binding protein